MTSDNCALTLKLITLLQNKIHWIWNVNRSIALILSKCSCVAKTKQIAHFSLVETKTDYKNKFCSVQVTPKSNYQLQILQQCILISNSNIQKLIKEMLTLEVNLHIWVDCTSLDQCKRRCTYNHNRSEEIISRRTSSRKCFKNSAKS